MPMYDFECPKCSHIFEDITTSSKILSVCPVCSELASVVFKTSPPILTHIIPSYPGCLKQKAGYMHTHGNKTATKLQSGYGGCTKPAS